MRKGNFILILVFIFSFSNCFAADDNLSHIPGAFVDIGYGARPMGLGGAFVGLADDRNAVCWNPAGLMKMNDSGISFMWAKQLGLIPYNYLCYSGNLGANQRIGGALIYSGDEVLSETTALISFAASLTSLGKNLNNYVFLDRFSGFVQKLAIAANVKIRWASFGNNTDGDPDRVTGDAFGYGLDLGMMWFVSEKISAGMLWRDIYNDIGWNSSVSGSYNEAVPSEFTFGASYRYSENTVAVIDMRKSLHLDVEERIMVGVEQKVFKIIQLRGGIGQNIGARYRNQDVSFGLGINQQLKSMNFNFDFAYILNDLKNTPRAGVSLNW